MMPKKTLIFASIACLLPSLFLAALVLSFYSYVNWQGEKRWREAAAELKARGEPLSWQDVVPSPVSDADNFYSSPLLRSPFNYTHQAGSSQMDYGDPGRLATLREIAIDDEDFQDTPMRNLLGSNVLTDLKPWRDYYQKSSVFPHSEGLPPVSVIKALSRHEKELNEFLLFSKRPESRLFVHHEEEPKFSVSMGDIGSTLRVSNTFALRSLAYLQSGRTAEAWADLQVLLKFHQAYEKEPSILTNLVSITVMGIFIEPVWEGLAMNAWSPAQLQEISRALAKIDFFKGYHQSMRGEVIFYMLPTMDYLKNSKSPAFQEMLAGTSGKSANLIHYFLPRGTYDIAKVSTVRMLYDRALPLIDLKERRYDSANALLLDSYLKNLKPYSPIDWLISLIIPSYKTAAQKSVEIQADVDMARIACTLELFHHEKGFYPKALDELNQSLPLDVVNGKPYHYEAIPGGRYRLWGVGWNELNDSGKVIYKDPEGKRVDRSQGDWVWAYPEKIPSP